MGTQEKSVDERLEDFLKQTNDQPLNKKRKCEVLVKDNENEEEQEEADIRPISRQQQEEIFSFLVQEKGPLEDKVLQTVEKIRNLTEDEAKHYIQCLKMSQHSRFSQQVTQRMMKSVSAAVLHEGDQASIDSIAGDSILVTEMNTMFGSLFSRLGILKGPFMLGVYIALQLYEQKKAGMYVRSSIPQPTGNNAYTTIPPDGSSPKPAGKNVPHD